MKKIKIFEPAMCCSTGLCGVSVDPELLRVSTALNALKRKGIIIERYNLSNAPQEFVANQPVSTFLREHGVEGLPVITVEDEIVISGRYPSNDEFLKLLGLSKNDLMAKPRVMRAQAKRTSGCGCSDGDCGC